MSVPKQSIHFTRMWSFCHPQSKGCYHCFPVSKHLSVPGIHWHCEIYMGKSKQICIYLFKEFSFQTIIQLRCKHAADVDLLNVVNITLISL